MKLTRKELQRKNKTELFKIYTSYFNDEMSPLMWRGLTKADILEIMLNGQNKVETPWD